MRLTRFSASPARSRAKRLETFVTWSRGATEPALRLSRDRHYVNIFLYQHSGLGLSSRHLHDVYWNEWLDEHGLDVEALREKAKREATPTGLTE